MEAKVAKKTKARMKCSSKVDNQESPRAELKDLLHVACQGRGLVHPKVGGSEEI